MSTSTNCSYKLSLRLLDLSAVMNHAIALCTTVRKRPPARQFLEDRPVNESCVFSLPSNLSHFFYISLMNEAGEF